MARVYASIGSNIDRESNITTCCQALSREFGALDISVVYETDAVGFSGAPFYNLAVGFDTEKEAAEVIDCFRRIEAQQGRERTQPKFSSRTIDIDLLLYDDAVIEGADFSIPRPEIVEQAFVLKPLADLCSECLHPLENKTIGQLWSEFRGAQDSLRPVRNFCRETDGAGFVLRGVE